MMTDAKSLVFIGKEDGSSDHFHDLTQNTCLLFQGYLNQLKKIATGKIMIKPNILPTEFRNNGLAVTNPKICAALAFQLKNLGFQKIFLAEGTTNNRKGEPNTLEAMDNNGFSTPEYSGLWEQVDLNEDDVGGWFEIYSPGDEENSKNEFDIEIGISKLALTYPVVSCAKLKAHDVLGLTLSIKNLMGCLTKARRKSTGELLNIGPKVKSYMHGFGARNPYQLPKKELNFTVSKTALAINLARMAKKLLPSFSVIETFPAMEGNGPISGKAKPINVLIASNDAVSADAVACALVGIDLAYNQYVLNFNRLNLGISNLSSIQFNDGDLFKTTQKNVKFRFHEWFKHAKFTPNEIERLIEMS